jgi:transitional endoplasmic reticulum ATPase
MQWLPILIFGAIIYLVIRKGVRKTKLSGNNATSNADFANEYSPVKSRMSFSRIAGMSDLKSRLLSAGREAKTGGRNGILLYGDPGNGKTMFAEALAGELGIPLLKVSIADIKSRWIGETTERLVSVMNAAGRRPCVLFLDEVESIIPPRDNNMRSDTEEPKITAAFLTMINDLRKKRGVVIVAATNYLQMVDPAAIRDGRFDWRIEITAPDQEARVALLASTVSGLKIGGTVLDSAAARLSGYSAAKVMGIGKEVSAAHSNRSAELSLEDFVTAQKTLAGSSGDSIGEDAPNLNQLILGDTLSKQLTSLVSRMRDPATARAKGGTIPTGVIFYGDPGNGKTMAARAIGKETGWGFLSVTGADLMKEDAVKKLLKRANDIRPCIIFLDEADGVLADRDSWQAKTDAINSLLTAMDGSGGRMTDVVWIAATNRLESIDQAMLRGGRFSEKINFPNPDSTMMESAISGWLSGVRLKILFSVAEAVEVLGGLSFSTAREAIQAAVNHAIGLEKNDLALDDLRFARDIVSSHR